MKFDILFKQTIVETDQTELLNQLIGNNDNEDIPDEVDNEEPSETPETVDDNDETDEDEQETEDKEEDEQAKKKADEEEKQKINRERTERLEKYANKVVSDIKFQVDKNPKTILDDFRTYGADEAAKRYIEFSFIAKVKDADEKLFLTLNIDELSPMVSAKLSDKFLQILNSRG